MCRFFLLGVKNLIEVVNSIVLFAVVCGLKNGVGLQLASNGIWDIPKLSWGGGHDCISMAVVCALLSMFRLRDNGNKIKRRERTSEEEEGH